MEECLNEDVMYIIFKFFSANERARLKGVCKRWLSLLNQMDVGKLVIFEHIGPFVGKLRLKDEHWSHSDTLATESLEVLFRNGFFLNQFRKITSLIVYGNYFVQKSRRCTLNINFNNLTYLELHHCNYENLDKFKSNKITHLYLNKPCDLDKLFTNFSSLQHAELSHLNSVSNFFNQMYSLNLITFKTENYLDSKDVKKLIRYCPKLEKLYCKLTYLHLLQPIVNKLRHINLVNFYTSDCSELTDEDKKECRNFIANKRPDLTVIFCGLLVDCHSIDFLFHFIQVKKYHNWSIIESNRLLELIANYSNELNYLDEYFKMTKMLRLFDNVQLNETLCTKLKNLKKLLISKCSADNFLFLISNLSHLRHLSMNACHLDRKYFDYIPIYCEQLTELVINSCNLKSFEFIHNLKNVQQVVLLLDKMIELQDYLEIIENCYYLVVLRANVLKSNSDANSKLMVKSICSNFAVQEKVKQFPNIDFKFVMLHADFFNAVEVNSETVLRKIASIASFEAI